MHGSTKEKKTNVHQKAKKTRALHNKLITKKANVHKECM